MSAVPKYKSYTKSEIGAFAKQYTMHCACCLCHFDETQVVRKPRFNRSNFSCSFNCHTRFSFGKGRVV